MTGTLLIRADANAAIGTGHVMRCLAIAQVWTAAGGKVLLLATDLPPVLEPRLREAGIELHRRSAPVVDDARQTISLAERCNARWIVADGYAFGSAWQREIKTAGFKLLVCDDHGSAEHYHADVVLNQNSSARAELYARRDPATRLLLGARHAMLRGEFQAWRTFAREHRAIARNVLVTLGGSDPDNVTARVMAAATRFPEFEFKVIVGAGNPHLGLLEELRAPHRNVQLVVNAANMPELMAWADIAIAAGGSTCWELAFMGLPALVTVLAENQAAIAADLDRRGVCENLGDFQSLDAERIAAALQSLAGDQIRRRQVCERGRRLVDGRGASRVAATLGARLALNFVSDVDSWLNPSLAELKAAFEADGHRVRWTHDPAAIEEGDVAFLLSLGRVVPAAILRRNAHNLVVHESALPQGRGWSPLTWQILEGKGEITVTLFEAADGVDSGEIYAQRSVRFRGDELVGELRAAQAAATLELCRDFVARYPFVLDDARSQTGAPTHYPRRRPADSRLDPDKSLREQFNLLRVCDPDRYPAFFELSGQRYEVRVSKSPARAGQSLS